MTGLAVVIAIVIATIITLIIFLYLMGHPNPKEPRIIYNLRRHPSAIPEYIALLGYGLFNTPNTSLKPMIFSRSSSS